MHKLKPKRDTLKNDKTQELGEEKVKKRDQPYWFKYDKLPAYKTYCE